MPLHRLGQYKRRTIQALSQLLLAQSYVKPLKRPMITTHATRSSSGRLKATSKGTPFLTK
jgi:hypothetical protein